VNQDRHPQLGGERIDAAQLLSVGGDVELHLAEALRAILHGLREHLLGVGLRDVVAVEPGDEPARRRRLKRFHLVEGACARQQIRLRDAHAVEMREVAGRLLTQVAVQVEDGRAPVVRAVRAGWRRKDDAGRHRFEELTASQHELSFERLL